MPNAKTHASWGAAIGGLVAGLVVYGEQQAKVNRGEVQEIEWGKVLGWGLLGAGVGAVVGVLPDLLEPATHPRHRALFHSVAFGTAGSIGVRHLLERADDPDLRKLILCAAASYGSHLVLDAGTPLGLPVI